MAVLFISEDTIKKSTTINGNVDAELLLPYIKVAQDIHIHQLLGTDLYDKLASLITAGTMQQTANDDYETLIDKYVQPVLIHYSLYECLPFLSYKIMNKDLVRKISEQSSAASLEDLKYLRGIVLNTAEYYAERLVEWLKNNHNKYPEYTSNTGADLSPTKEAYFSGMNLQTGIQGKAYKGITLRNFFKANEIGY
tara:strand:- start:748 stop:1332 length:585 start_codon:yes stop_codon:yes gene_type:complete